jgi:hypothetical protein
MLNSIQFICIVHNITKTHKRVSDENPPHQPTWWQEHETRVPPFNE